MQPLAHTIDPEKPETIAAALTDHKAVLSMIGFGDPVDRESVTPGENGTPDNVHGAWVVHEFTAVGSGTFSHNLDIQVSPTANEPNVGWLVFGWRHSGAGAAPGPLSLEYVHGSAITRNAIDLTLRVGGTRTVGAAPNAVKVAVFFVPASGW